MTEIYKLWKESYNVKSGVGTVRNMEAIYISNMGNVRGRNIYTTPDGYYTIKYKSKRYRVNRLVAELFIPNPDDLPEVDHINTVKTDNRVENLRWVSHKVNGNNELTRQHHSINNAMNKAVKDNISGQIFRSAAEYARFVKKSPGTVGNWFQGRRPFPKGYSAQYI